MVHRNMGMMAVVVCLTVMACPGAGAPQDAAGDAKEIEGLWSGSWGGGERNGVVFQPVIAELLIKGDQIEISGFPNLGELRGTVRINAGARRMRITPAAAGGRPAKGLEYTYELKGDRLTLTDGGKVSVALQKLQVTQAPLANAQVEFVAAAGINDAGDLLVTRFTALVAGRAGVTYYQPRKESLSTKQATVLLVQETGLKNVTVEQARRLVREAPAVVVTYRQDDRPAPPPAQQLWKDGGSPTPDSEAVRQTFARVLRPETLVFVLSARENVPRP
jgi:hypothetical protein